MHPRVSIVIPLYNNASLTRACLESLVAHTPDELYDVILVDNASTDDTAALLKQLDGDVTIIRNQRNRGFGYACNQGARAANGDLLLFLNNDTAVTAGWLPPLMRVLDSDTSVGAVGARLLLPDGTIQHAGVGVVARDTAAGRVLYGRHLHYRASRDAPEVTSRRDVSVVTGACLLTRTAMFHALNGFDEGFVNGNEDIDLCLRLASCGRRVVYEPDSVVWHYESAARGERFAHLDANVERLTTRWRDDIVAEIAIDRAGVERSVANVTRVRPNAAAA